MRFRFLVILLVSFLIVFGCGGGGDNDSSSGNLTPEDQTPALPSDPGDSGKLTLEGIDSDNDGVRDDVQIAIAERYPNDEEKQAALRQKAKAIQKAIIAGDLSDTNEIIEASKSVLKAVDCLHIKVDDPTADISFIEEKMINTPDRSEAYTQFNDALSGQFFGESDTENPCE